MIAIILCLYFFFSACLFIYSYGFLDFNLTLSSHPLFLQFVGPLQHLVYFQRADSARIFVGIFVLLFLLYLLILKSLPKFTKFPFRPWLFIIILLTCCYPMLSYDLYNYMFHAKILWFYHANPHLVAPLEFTGDLWLRFMRWVHTPSAYGPMMTAVESPAYLLGMGKFVPVLYLMKVTMTAFFAWCVYLIGQIVRELGGTRKNQLMSQLLIAFNPFLILELVINGHNDSVMIAFFLAALYYSLRQGPRLKSISLLVLSIAVKYVTALVAPLYFIKKKELRVIFTVAILLLPVLVSPHRFQPWYLTWSLIPAVLIDRTWARIWIYFASLLAVYFYVPYIGTGFWNNTQLFVYIILYTPLLIAFKWVLPHIRD